jgi:flagellar hook-length control protein FliK
MSRELILVPLRNEPRKDIQKEAGSALQFPVRRNEAKEGPTFNDVLGSSETRPGEKFEKNDKTDQNVKTVRKEQEPDQDGKAAVIAFPLKASALRTALEAGNPSKTDKSSLLKDIAAMLKPASDKVKDQKAGKNVKDELMSALSKMDTDELRKILEKIKSGANQDLMVRDILTPGRNVRLQSEKNIRAGMDRNVIAAEQAFKAVVTSDGLKIAVDKSRIDVTDKRTGLSGHNAHGQVLAFKSSAREASTQNGSAGNGNSGTGTGSGNMTASNQNSAVSFDQALGAQPNGQAKAHGPEGANHRSEPMPDLKATNQMFNDIVRYAKMILEDKKSVMQIDLKPEHLGRLMLKIEVTDNKIVSAQIFTQNENTGDMLKQHMSELAEAFKQSGLGLGSLNVNVNSGGEGFFKDQDSVSGLEKVVSNIRKNDDVQGSAEVYHQFGNVNRQTVDAIV